MVDQQTRVSVPRPPAAERVGQAPARRIRRAGVLTPYLFLAPYLLVFATFVVAPALYGLWISLHDWDYLLPGKPFVGLENYRDLFDPESYVFSDFWRSMGATGIFTVASVPFLVVVPFGAALLLNRNFPGRTFFRAVYFLPFVLGVVVVGLLFRFLLDSNIGLVNYLLGLVGLPSDTPWVTDLPWAWVSLVAMTVWWTMGFNAVIYLAGLQDIPRDLYDAAAVDGANRWQQFRNVTLPGLRPVLFFIVTTTILASANMFGQSYVVTHGAPGTSTRTIIMYIADQGLSSYKMGSAAAMSYLFALILALVSVLNFRLFFRNRD